MFGAPRGGFPSRVASAGSSRCQQVSSTVSSANEQFQADLEKGSSNILVAVRIRPEHDKEKESNHFTVVRAVDQNVVCFDPADSSGGSPQRTTKKTFLKRRSKDIRYAFDRVFDERTTQLEVYQNTTKFLIPGILNGFNATVFAYGATGAGKTYTMSGCDATGPGVMVQTMEDLFREIQNRAGELTCKVSMQYLEVYNETIRDLLCPENSDSLKAGLQLREDPVRGMVVGGLSEHLPTCAEEVLDLLQKGNANRSKHPTEANQESSRSHAVLQIMVEMENKTADTSTDVRTGKLSLIDLAGSERASMTKNRGARLKEGANINKSLLALGNCINALGQTVRAGKRPYVPYRDSKLTRLLKDSLGGNCRTVMIANVGPSSVSYEDTHNTLKYANRAKNIKTRVSRNVVNVKFHLAEYNRIIAEQRQEIENLKKKLSEQASFALPSVNEQKLEEEARIDDLCDTLRQVQFERIKNKRSIMVLEERNKENECRIIAKEEKLRRWKAENTDPAAQMPVHLCAEQRDLGDYKNQKCKDRVIMEKLIKDDKILEERWNSHNAEIQHLSDHRVVLATIRELNADMRCVELERSQARHAMTLNMYKQNMEDLESNLTVVQTILREQANTLKANGMWNEELESQYSMGCELCDSQQGRLLRSQIDEKRFLEVNNSVVSYRQEVSECLVTPLKAPFSSKQRVPQFSSEGATPFAGDKDVSVALDFGTPKGASLVVEDAESDVEGGSSVKKPVQRHVSLPEMIKNAAPVSGSSRNQTASPLEPPKPKNAWASPAVDQALCTPENASKKKGANHPEESVDMSWSLNESADLSSCSSEPSPPSHPKPEETNPRSRAVARKNAAKEVLSRGQSMPAIANPQGGSGGNTPQEGVRTRSGKMGAPSRVKMDPEAAERQRRASEFAARKNKKNSQFSIPPLQLQSQQSAEPIVRPTTPRGGVVAGNNGCTTPRGNVAARMAPPSARIAANKKPKTASLVQQQREELGGAVDEFEFRPRTASSALSGLNLSESTMALLKNGSKAEIDFTKQTPEKRQSMFAKPAGRVSKAEEFKARRLSLANRTSKTAVVPPLDLSGKLHGTSASGKENVARPGNSSTDQLPRFMQDTKSSRLHRDPESEGAMAAPASVTTPRSGSSTPRGTPRTPR